MKSTESGLASRKYQNCQLISITGNLRLQWTVDKSSGRIALAISADIPKPTGSIYLAWTGSKKLFLDKAHPEDPSLIMDSWIVSYSQNTDDFCHRGCVLDTWLNRNSPREDREQHFDDIVVSFADGTLTGEWTRDLVIVDGQDVDINLDNHMYVQWSILEIPVTGTKGALSFPKHPLNLVGTSPVSFSQTTSCDLTTPRDNSIVSRDKQFAMKWDFPNEDYVAFEISARATGWISMGFNQNPSMTDCDMWTGWVDSQGRVFLHDTYSFNSADRPPFDEEELGGRNDVESVEGEEVDGVTTIRFRRKLKTGDAKGRDFDVVNDDIYLIWGLHETLDGKGTYYQEHTLYGVEPFNFYTTNVSLQTDPGWALSVTMFSLLAIYVVVYYASGMRKLIQARKSKSRMARQEKHEQRHLSTRNAEIELHRTDPGAILINREFDSIEKATRMDANDTDTGSSRRAVRPKRRYCLHRFVLNARTCNSQQITSFQAFVATVYVAINILCLLWGRQSLPNKFGHLAAANMLFASIPAARNSILLCLVDLSVENVIWAHRWVGRWAIFLLTFHALTHSFQWAASGLDVPGKIFGKQTNMFGFLGFVSALIMLMTSIEFMRRRHFELFYYFHHFFITLYVFAALHTDYFRPYFIASLGLYTLDKVSCVLRGTMPHRTRHLKLKTPDTLQIRVKKPLFNRLFTEYGDGQYLLVNIPQVDVLQWHPFSISSGPREKDFEIHVRALGSYTRRVVERAKDGESLWVRVEGPYGGALRLKRRPVMVYVVGGIGVTPVIGMLKNAFDYDVDRSTEPARSLRHVHFLWAIKKEQDYSWFSEEIQRIKQISGSRGDVPKFHPRIFITQTASMDNARAPIPNAHYGRPELLFILQSICSTHSNEVRCLVRVCVTTTSYPNVCMHACMCPRFSRK